MISASTFDQFIQDVPKNVLRKQNKKWVLWGLILSWTWLGRAWSGLVLVRNDQKIDFHSQGVSATGDWASALKHSESAFFLGHPGYWNKKDITTTIFSYFVTYMICIARIIFERLPCTLIWANLSTTTTTGIN